MSKPQQPELHRSGHTPADPGHAKETAGGALGAEGGLAPVPVDNQPGHHPDVEQDKPQLRLRDDFLSPPDEAAPPAPVQDARPPAGDEPTPPRSGRRRRFGFAFDPMLLPAAASFGITPFTAGVVVDGDRLRVRFGLWRIETPLANVAGVERTGPYRWFKVIGPPRLSLADRGLTFATTAREGVCIRFRKPVPGLEPTGLLRHPAITVTVADCAGLVAALEEDAARAA